MWWSYEGHAVKIMEARPKLKGHYGEVVCVQIRSLNNDYSNFVLFLQSFQFSLGRLCLISHYLYASVFWSGFGLVEFGESNILGKVGYFCVWFYSRDTFLVYITVLLLTSFVWRSNLQKNTDDSIKRLRDKVNYEIYKITNQILEIMKSRNFIDRYLS